MYQDGNAAALFVRLEVVPSELILMSAGEKRGGEGQFGGRDRSQGVSFPYVAYAKRCRGKGP